MTYEEGTFKIFIHFICLCERGYCVHIEHEEACGSQGRVLEPLELSYKQLLTTTWMLETEPRSSERATSALNS